MELIALVVFYMYVSPSVAILAIVWNVYMGAYDRAFSLVIGIHVDAYFGYCGPVYRGLWWLR